MNLIDFGAAKEFSETFINDYRRLLVAAVDKRPNDAIELSIKLGFLTGDETQAMNNAHLASLMTLAEPFRRHNNGDEQYDFGVQKVSADVRKQIPIMLKYRLTPPPQESYSLHRKLSGAFLLCSKLKSRVECRALFDRYCR